MSEASETPTSTAAPRRQQRRIRNYLLDRSFQLKYAAILSGIALALSVGLGVLVWRTSSQVITQGQATVERGKEVLVQSRRVNEVVAMNIAKEYADDPVLAKTFAESAANDERKLQAEQERLERDANSLAEHQRTLLFSLVLALGVLVVSIGLAGIVVTHKIAGPVYKMKRLLREVGDGRLVMRERLRKGDELQHFFEAFEGMVGDLRARRSAEISRIDAIVEKLSVSADERASASERDAIEELKALRREFQKQLEG